VRDKYAVYKKLAGVLGDMCANAQKSKCSVWGVVDDDVGAGVFAVAEQFNR
jgi:hypothetical protein